MLNIDNEAGMMMKQMSTRGFIQSETDMDETETEENDLKYQINQWG